MKRSSGGCGYSHCVRGWRRFVGRWAAVDKDSLVSMPFSTGMEAGELYGVGCDRAWVRFALAVFTRLITRTLRASI
jgi:hypothetical protein